MNKFDKKKPDYKPDYKFDKPYYSKIEPDKEKIIELFKIIKKLNISELIRYSFENQISLNLTDEFGNSLIHIVIMLEKTPDISKLNIIKELYENGVNPDKSNNENQTPLHLACSLQLEIIVNYLLSLKVNINYQDNFGYTPFHYLLAGNSQEIKEHSDNNIEISSDPINIKLDKKLLEIKQLLWPLINSELEDTYPLLNVLKLTIKKLVELDDLKNNIKDIQNNTINTININDINDIKIDIFNIKNKITQNIENKLKMSKNININIHKTEKNSWSPLNDKSELSLIKNGNIQDIIQDDIKKCIYDIEKLINDFSINPTQNKFSHFNDGFNEYQI